MAAVFSSLRVLPGDAVGTAKLAAGGEGSRFTVTASEHGVISHRARARGMMCRMAKKSDSMEEFVRPIQKTAASDEFNLTKEAC